MTGKKTGRIPNRQMNLGLRGNLDTSATADGTARPISGTPSADVSDTHYEDLPPPRTSRAASSNWTAEKIGSYVGLIGAGIAVAFFFFQMASDIGVIKTEVKEQKDKIEKQSSSIDNVASSVQRLEAEIRRTQDYVRDRRK